MKSGLCNHVKTNGTVCESPALKRKPYCYFHTASRERATRQRRAARLQQPFQLPLLEDANSIQLAIGETLNALLSGQIDHKTAGLILYGLQTAPATSATPISKSPSAIVAPPPIVPKNLNSKTKPQSQQPSSLPQPPALSRPRRALTPQNRRNSSTTPAPWPWSEPAPSSSNSAEKVEEGIGGSTARLRWSKDGS
jgi:hypothetical protein